MSYDKDYLDYQKAVDGLETVDELIEGIADFYHAEIEQVKAVQAIVDAIEVYVEDGNTKQLIESLMYEESQKFMPCSVCDKIFPVEDLVDAGTGSWTDDLCQDCQDAIDGGF